MTNSPFIFFFRGTERVGVLCVYKVGKISPGIDYVIYVKKVRIGGRFCQCYRVIFLGKCVG